MATRLWLDPSTAAPVSPAYSAEWDATTSALRRYLRTIPVGTSAATSVVMTDTVTTANQDHLAFQFVSAPLVGDQTITGTLKALLRARESSTSADMRPQLLAKVVSGDGTTVRGVLYAGDLSTTLANELTQSTTNLYSTWFPGGASTGVTLTSVSALSGDRIVIEVGIRSHNVVATSYNATVQAYGNSAGTGDYTAAASTVTTLRPWFEFSQDLVMQGRLRSISSPVQVLVEPASHANWDWIAEGDLPVDVDLPAADITLWDQRTFYGTLSLPLNVSPAGHLRTLDYDWREGSMQADVGMGLASFQPQRGFTASMDAGMDPAMQHPKRVFSGDWIWRDGQTIRWVNWLIRYDPAVADPTVNSPLTFGETHVGFSTTLRMKHYPPIVLPDPPPVHVPPEIDPEDPPEAAIDVTPPVASGITIRALHGIVVDMATPTVTNGKPS